MLQLILCILSTTRGNETHARVIISVRISGRPSVCVSLSVSRSVGVSLHSHVTTGGTVDDIL